MTNIDDILNDVPNRWEDINKNKMFGNMANPTLEVIDFIETCKKYQKKNILDIGIGSGRHINYASTSFVNTNLFGVDISASSVSQFHDKYKSLKIPIDNILQGSILDLPFENNKFDAIICRAVITHFTFKNIELAISQIYKKLNANGLVLLTFVSKDSSQFKLGKDIEENTWIMPDSDIEHGIPHHFTDTEEVDYFTSPFKKLKMYHHQNPEEQIDKTIDSKHFKYKFISSHYIFIGSKPNF